MENTLVKNKNADEKIENRNISTMLNTASAAKSIFQCTAIILSMLSLLLLNYL